MEVARAILDEDFQRSLDTLGRLRRELLEQSTQPDGRVLRRTRCVLDIELPGAAKAFIGEGDPAWVESAAWSDEELTWSFTIDPEMAEELLEAGGTIQLSANEKGTLRRIEGRIKVGVPFYGGKVEGWIVKGLTDAYHEEAERLRAWMRS